MDGDGARPGRRRPFLYQVLTQNRWRRLGKTGEINTGSETLVARTQGAARRLRSCGGRCAR
jgi:hypothetical protein